MSRKEIHRHDLSTNEIVTRYATLDIETSSVDPEEGQTVAIGIGTVDVLDGEMSVDVLSYGSAQGSEKALIRRAFTRINEFEPSALVTFNGEWFDLDFLDGRIERLEFDRKPTLECAEHHLDLFLPRKQKAETAGVKWPKLETVLSSHDLSVPVTEWRGQELTNTRFGEELAPAYLESVQQGNEARVDDLESVIYEYTATDVEANIALYEADAGRQYEPMLLT
ncbi:ribonuclease H-like domain-containing protein [Haloferax sp. KTX1]|uniref:ribonuclease H-like domain-containing protein n=1 Tax=Haloferax sp. KTX1 TaxID=2600597 RepID=UPI001651C33E|nr:ribonuclease H-like domain-containing protein [Haloferax sp. KTX1]